MSKFYIPSTSPSATSTPAYDYSPTDTDDEDTLPYPAELTRNDFLAPDFDPQTYLSSLRNRHQTLEDLRSELRQRSQLLSKELLDLVNGNYEEFLSLGGDLKGGEEIVEGVRLGLLGFQREVEGIKKAVHIRATETGELLQEKKTLSKDVVLGRALLELEESITELEESLGIKDEPIDDADEDLEEDDDMDRTTSSDSAQSKRLQRLQRHATQYVLLMRLSERLGRNHPFVVAQTARLSQVRKTLLLDAASALRQAKSAKDADSVLGILGVYSDLGAETEAIRIMKG